MFSFSSKDIKKPRKFRLFRVQTKSKVTNRVYCKLYDSNGVLKQEGFLATSEQEYNSRIREYASFTLGSGDSILLDAYSGDPFHTIHETTVYFKFGLGSNINALVKIIDEHFNIEYKS